MPSEQLTRGKYICYDSLVKQDCGEQLSMVEIYIALAEVPSVAWVLNGLSVDAVYPILLLYPTETLAPSLSCRNLLLGSLLCPLAC